MALLVVVAAVLIAFWPALHARALSFDDNEYVRRNPLVTRPSAATALRFFTEVTRPSTFTGYYHPLSMVLLMTGHAAGGRADHPFAFHAISLALHAANAALVLLLVFRLFGALVPAALVAILFALHPLTVEPVAWIGEQKTLLAGFFSLAALVAYVEHARADGGRWLLIAAGLYLLALLSKPTATMLPLLFLVLDYWPLSRLSLRAVREKWLLFLLGAAGALVTLVSQQRVGGITPSTPVDLALWPLRVFYVLAFYLRKLVWPAPLSSAYPQPEPMTLFNPVVFMSIALVVAVTIGLLFVARRSRGPLAASWCWRARG